MKLKKTVWTSLFSHTITATVIFVLCGWMPFVLSGCPEAQNMMQPVVSEPADTTPPVTMGEVKEEPEAEETDDSAEEEKEEPEASGVAEEEPETPVDTTSPVVVEVSWYGDSQRTKSLTADSVIRPGDTVYTVVVFSEPVMHTVAADDTARPALSIVVDGMEEQYTMLSHGVRFQSGEAKPLQGGTDDYLCKYTIPAGIVGTPALRVGSATTDIAGNAAETSAHTAPFTITEPEPEPPEPHVNDFTGQVLLIPDGDRDTFLRTHTRPVAGVVLTIVSGERAGEQSTTDENGNYRFSDPAREIHALHVRTEKEGFEPKEVMVHRSEPTVIRADGAHFSSRERKPQETPGTILIGHAWPDKVRFILEETVLPHDLILVRVDDTPEGYSGLYGDGVVLVRNGTCLMFTIAHELAHAHQHAIAVIAEGPSAITRDWEDTPEGIAYARAWEKDLQEVGEAWYDGGLSLTPVENMAETANFFWNIRGKFDTRLCFSIASIAEEAPNRLRWAQEWLGKQY